MSPSGRPWTTRMWGSVVASLTERLPYKAAALFFSLVLWLVVSAEETAEELVPVRLSASMDSSILVVGRPPAMRALVVGKARDLMKIGDRPLVLRRVFTAETPESVRVELRPADIDVPAGTSVVVRDVQPRTFTLHFAPTLAELRRRRAPAGSAAVPPRSVVPPAPAAESASTESPRADSGLAPASSVTPVARSLRP